MPNFTDRYLRSLTATGQNRRLYEGGADRGFCLQVTVAGSIIFEQQYTVDGKTRFQRLGRYPETTLAVARLKARDVRSLVDQGIDPKHRQVDTGTVAQLMEAYLAHLESKGRKTTTNIRRSIEANFLAKFGDRPAKDIQPRDIRETLYQLIKRDARTHANRLRSHLHAMFRYGVHHDNDPKSLSSAMTFQIENNPVANVPRDQSAERVGQRVLSWEEIRQVWHDERLSLPSRLAIQLILVTGGQRVRMITGAPWSEIDIKESLWLVPGSRMKARQDHLIPITDIAMSAIGDLAFLYPHSDWLFPSRHNPAATKPQDLCTLPHAIQGYCKLAGMEPWVPKDLRRTAKTRMGEIGIAKDIRDRIQGHAMQDVSSRHYDRYSYVSEKREALERWEKHLGDLLRG